MKKSPKYLRTATIESLARRNKKPTCISLFTGCGGCALGFNQAGFEIRVMVEWMKDACKTLRCNWTMEGIKNQHVGYQLVNAKRKKQGKKMLLPRWYQKREPAIMEVDITKTSTAEILKAAELEVGEATLLEGGFPCQGFSRAGKQMIDDPRNQLYKKCVRVIKEALPRMFMLENVPGLVSMSKGAIMRQICEDLAACGYQVSWEILNAADYGVPQNRKRVFIIGMRQDLFYADALNKGKNPRLIMGAYKGDIKYPAWFVNRYAKYELTIN